MFITRSGPRVIFGSVRWLGGEATALRFDVFDGFGGHSFQSPVHVHHCVANKCYCLATSLVGVAFKKIDNPELEVDM